MKEKIVKKKFVKREDREVVEPVVELTEEDLVKQARDAKRIAGISFWWWYALGLVVANVAVIGVSFVSHYAMHVAPALVILAVPLYVAWIRTLKVRMHESINAFFVDVPAWALLISVAAVAYMVVSCIANIHGLRDGYGVVEDGICYLKKGKIMMPIPMADYAVLRSFVCKLICGTPAILIPAPLMYITSAKVAKK